MKRSISCLVMLLGMGISGCSSDQTAKGGVTAGNGGGEAGNGTSSGGSSFSGSGDGGAPTTLPGTTPSPMLLISGDAPAFASSSLSNGGPDLAKDRTPDSHWQSTAVPAWLAYDLSGAPIEQRHQVLIAWYGGSAVDFLDPTPDPTKILPVDYTLEINNAPGGGTAPPADGWEVVATVTGNDRNSRQRLVDLAGANWVRMNITKATAPDAVGLDLDVHAAPDGASDSWLLMGDSITFISTTYLFSDLPTLVHQLKADRFPAIIPAGIGGTNTTSALAAIDNTLADYPGRFVGLSYGTNDHVNEFQMEDLVKKVIALGKTPVVPHMPWSSSATSQTDGPQINAIIDGLYGKYPEILPGPDLWKLFTNRPDLIPAGDVHPNAAGQEALRAEWAKTMTQ